MANFNFQTVNIQKRPPPGLATFLDKRALCHLKNLPKYLGLSFWKIGGPKPAFCYF